MGGRGYWLALVGTIAAAAPSAHADPQAGHEVAVARCQPCHGIDGIALIPEAPNIAGQSRAYLIKQIYAFRAGERTDEKMAGQSMLLSEEEIADVADWYASIRFTVSPPD